jgi:hypothetical protein
MSRLSNPLREFYKTEGRFENGRFITPRLMSSIPEDEEDEGLGERRLELRQKNPGEKEAERQRKGYGSFEAFQKFKGTCTAELDIADICKLTPPSKFL